MKALTSLLILCALAMTATAQDNSVQFASDKFEAFHEIMHPAWHEAYPAKDYAAILSTGAKFEAAFVPIGKLEPAIKNSARLAKFHADQKVMGERVAEFAAACKANDSLKAYEFLPNLHTAFEDAMWDLQPMEFKPLDGILVTVDVILDMHVPAENWDGMAGSTETLQMKIAHLQEDQFPQELAASQSAIKIEVAEGAPIVDQMKMAVEKKDLTSYREKATELKKLLVSIRENYL